MLAYTTEELLQLRQNSVPLSRRNRKVIFSNRLWLLRYQRAGISLLTSGTHDYNNNKMTANRQAASAAVDPKKLVAPRCGQQKTYVPSLYVFNAAGLAKPHAVEHLAAELISYNVDVAIITETHFKARHTDSVINIQDYTVFRRDRSGRKGGGVALYVRSNIETAV